MENPDYVFECKKCRHRLYASSVKKIIEYDCPECGEESYLNWIFFRMGNYDKEHGEQKKSDNRGAKD